jgi:hypothetical protein
VQRTEMVKHRSNTRWLDDREVGLCYVGSAPCTRRHGAQVSWFGLKTKVDGFSRFGLKTGNYGLVVLASKLSRQFFGLDFKIKWATVYQLCHKTNRRMKTVRDRRQDLVACFTWKQDGVGFPNLTSRLVEA